LKEGKVSGLCLQRCRHHGAGDITTGGLDVVDNAIGHTVGTVTVTIDSAIAKAHHTSSSWRNASQSITEADTPALVVIPIAQWIAYSSP
jgi:hypothetical protein